jgi:hypothetical protein
MDCIGFCTSGAGPAYCLDKWIHMNEEGRVGRWPSRLWSFGDDGRWLDGRTFLRQLAAPGSLDVFGLKRPRG